MSLRWKLSELLAPLISVFLLCTTAFYWHNEEQETQSKRQRDFVEAADKIAFHFAQRLSNYELVVRGAKGFFEASETVTPVTYRSYFEALQLEQSHPGLQGLAVAMQVASAELADHTADMRKRGFAGYKLKPAGERDLYVPIVLIEPYSGRNVNAIGFDLASNPDLKGALEHSRDTGMVTLTGKTKLVQDAGEELPAVVMYGPIYARGLPLASSPQRRAAIVGWVSLPFRVRDLVASLQSQLDPAVRIEIYDGETLTPARRLYGNADGFALNLSHAGLRTTRLMNTGGKRWTLLMQALPAFDARLVDEKGHWLVAAIGSALSLLLGWLAWLLLTGRDRAYALAQAMTHDLREEQSDREAMLNALPDVLFELGLDGRYYNYHTSREDLLAAPPEVFLGKLVADVLPAPATAICLQALQEAHAKGYSSDHQIEIPLAGGKRWFELSVARKNITDNSEPRFIMISRDITERKEAENHLRLMAQVFKSSHEGIFITDAHNRILSANQAFTDITGYDESQVMGQDPRILASGRQGHDFYAAMWQSIQRDGNWQGEVWNQRKNGEVYPEWLSISAVKDASGSIFQYIGILTDLTESRAAQDRIDYLAHHDTLTGLPNHELLQDRTKLALATAKRTGNQAIMMFIDIDRFQAINDSLGRPVGDQMLKTLAARFTANLQTDDTVCRQGGDEFVFLLPNTDADNAAHIANRMLAVIKEPIVLGFGSEVILTACIGIAVYPDNGDDIDKLSQCADAALLQAKKYGRDSFRFFTEHIQSRAREALLVESHLHRALAMGELLLYYQPQVDAVSCQIIGAEALIRWQHPEWGMVSPIRFIPIAENSGQILAIGDWVLRTAAQQVVDWQLAGLDVVPVAVNLSARQFHQLGLCDTVKDALQACSLSPELLELELTESVAMEDSSLTLGQIGKLHAMGIRLSIDDFGTGYSSLSYLRRYQIDKLKIDQSFVQDLDNEQEDGAIVRAIIQMAHGLGFKTIAEGVETQKQLDFLRAHGCDEIQGYLFARPVPADEFASLLRNGGTLRPKLTT